MWDARNMIKVERRGGAPLFKKVRGDWELVLSSHDMKGGSCKMLKRSGKGKSCKGEGGLLLPLIFSEKKSDERGLSY